MRQDHKADDKAAQRDTGRRVPIIARLDGEPAWRGGGDGDGSEYVRYGSDNGGTDSYERDDVLNYRR